jgi:hypothetical protein
MKTIPEIKKHYEDYRTDLFESFGVFFAFSNQQLNEGKKEGVEYVQWMNGGFVPKDKAESFIEALEANIEVQEKTLSSEPHRRDYIAYELSNHEAYYTGDIDNALNVLSNSGITREEVIKVYRDEYPKQDI